MQSGKTRRLSVVVLCAVLAMPAAASAQGAEKGAAFNWLSNSKATAQQTATKAKAREAIRKARGLNAKATWVCSPAGFGQSSRCTRG